MTAPRQPERPAVNAGQELDAIMVDLDATTSAWVAAGYPWDGPVVDAREAVFARLRAWNMAREEGQRRPV